MNGKYCIIANEKYGLYSGIIESYDPVTGVVVATEVRHICEWYGKEGGVTSLAAFGVCGENKDRSKIGAPSKTSTLTGVVNVFECSSDARASFETFNG